MTLVETRSRNDEISRHAPRHRSGATTPFFWDFSATTWITLTLCSRRHLATKVILNIDDLAPMNGGFSDHVA